MRRMLFAYLFTWSIEVFAQSPHVLRTEEVPQDVYISSECITYQDKTIMSSQKRTSELIDFVSINALDTKTGKLLWTQKIDALADVIGVKDGVVYVLTRLETLYGFDVQTGQTRWSRATANGDGRLDLLFVGDDSALYHRESETDVLSKVDIETGAVLSQQANAGRVSILKDGGSLVVEPKTQNPADRSFSIVKKNSEGVSEWVFDDLHAPSYLRTAKELKNGKFVVSLYVSAEHPDPDERGRFFTVLLDAEGKRLWEQSAFGPPQVVADLSGEEHLLVMEESRRTLSSVNTKWIFKEWSLAFASDASIMDTRVAGDNVVFADQTGVRSVSLRRGRLNWTFLSDGTEYAPQMLAASPDYVIFTKYDPHSRRYTLYTAEN